MFEFSNPAGSLRRDALLRLLALWAVAAASPTWPLDAVETRYPDGAIHERYFITHDASGAPVKDSIYREFHQNGKKKLEIPYRRGVEHGVVRAWYPSGAPEFASRYLNGSLDGQKTAYFPGGRLKSRSTWSSGVQDGIAESWYENGQLRSQGSYCRNKRCGEFRCWYQNGKLHSMISLLDGDLNGPAKWYHANGELAIVGYYGERGEREFLWQLYRENGEQCARITYTEGAVAKKEYFAPDAVIDSLFKALERVNGKRPP